MGRKGYCFMTAFSLAYCSEGIKVFPVPTNAQLPLDALVVITIDLRRYWRSEGERFHTKYSDFSNWPTVVSYGVGQTFLEIDFLMKIRSKNKN